MLRQKIEQTGVQKGFAAQHPEKAVAVFPGVVHQPVQFIQFDHVPRRFHIDPAALAAEIAAVDDAEVKEGGENDPFFQALLEEHHRPRAFESEIPGHGGQ